MYRILITLFALCSFQTYAGFADLFKKKNDLVCVRLANGENCYSRSQAPKDYEVKEVKVSGFVLFSLVTHPEKEQVINLLNLQLLAQLEELTVLLEFLKEDTGSRTDHVESNIYQYLLIMNRNLKLTIQNAPPENYWSSQGTNYIKALKRDAGRAKCLKNNFFEIVSNQIEGQELVNGIESALIDCGFIDFDYDA